MDEDESKWVSTGIKIDRDLLRRVQQAADERCLGRNLLIRMALADYLDRLIPIDQLMRKEGFNEDQINGSSRFSRYLGGTDGGVHSDRPPGASSADPTGIGPPTGV